MKIILFNGEDEVIVTLDQIKELGKSSKSEIVSYFQATAVYRDVMQEMIKNIGKASLSVDDDILTDIRIQMVESGYQMISNELIEVFGEETGHLIIAHTHNAINLEKNESSK